jgi:hypothetical protein
MPMSRQSSHASPWLLVLFLVFTLCARAADNAQPAYTKLVVGSTLESITVGQVTYSQVRIRTISAQTAMIQHEGGIASLRLRDLTPELQQRFGYNPDAAAAEAEKQKAAAIAAEAARRRQAQITAQKVAQAARVEIKTPDSKIDQLLRSFGSPPQIQESVDLRPRYRELGLWIKNQGARSSCAIFSVVSALELQAAELTGQPQRYSEEYLQWATRKTLNRPAYVPKTVATISPTKSDLMELLPEDEGFRLPDVVTALRAYGIPPRDRVPYRSADLIEDPTDEIIEEARSGLRVTCHLLPGKDSTEQIANIIHALNLGIPVPVGMAWPQQGSGAYKTGYLDKQPTIPEGGHAVTIVGYKSPGGRLEATNFIFKNSYGTNWGIDGYGTATYAYLAENLRVGLILEAMPR